MESIKIFIHKWVINNTHSLRNTIIFFGILYLTIYCCNHYFYRTYAFDYAAYNFAFNDFSHFRISDCSVFPTEHVNFLQDHVSFTMFVFIPIYWLLGWLTQTYTLLIIQTAIILYGGWATFKLIELKTTQKIYPLLALLQYFILFGRWTSFVSDCNLAIIASSMIPVFIYYFEKKSIIPFFLSFIFILITREDMALWTLFIGIFFLSSHFKDVKLRTVSISIIGLSIIYFFVIFHYVIPLLETPFKKFTLFNYTALGANPSEALSFIIKHPIDTFKMFFINTSNDKGFDYVKFEFYYVYILSGGFLLFFRPKYLLLFIPILAKKMLNDGQVRWSVELYYSIEFVSILPLVIFLILLELKNVKLQKALVILVCIGTILIDVVKLNEHRNVDWWGDSKYAFYNSKMYTSDFSVIQVKKQLSVIPQDARISVSGSIATHLAFRKKVYFFPRIEDAEYIALFKNRDQYPFNPEQFKTVINQYLNDKSWMPIINNPTLLILKKRK